MNAKVAIETFTEAGYSELDETASFALNNLGDADAEVAFEQSGPFTGVPASSSLRFEYVGANYSGRVYVRFVPTSGQQSQRISLIKTIIRCNS